MNPGPAHRFGTFTGVFTPTLLTIVGVIMYVRLGWVVGNAGLGGALLVMGLAILITTCTGLSLSSIATNTRIGHGGPYAILNKSLGLEVGGSIGIPLFLTRPLGVAMYIFGFREGLTWVFPGLSPLIADLAIFGVLFGIAYKSADLAFKTQYVIMGIVALSLISIFSTPVEAPGAITWFGDYPGAPESGFGGTDFWGVFAVFFPATTGILAGANMSGELKDPRRAIPRGTLWAIALSSIIYFAVAVWMAQMGTMTELQNNYTLAIDKARFPTLVLMGLLGATASSALAGLVGGPRILMAMGANNIVPFSHRMAAVRDGEPRNALLVTGVLTLMCIMVRDLNNIAPLVTMFFLITYCMINVVVLLEASLGLVSFRPTMRLPRLVPMIGLVGCLFSMFIINPAFSLLSAGVVVALYLFIGRRVQDLEVVREDMRSSVFVALAEWAAGWVRHEDSENVRSWKPHVLVPVEDIELVRGSYTPIVDFARPEGSVKLVGISTQYTPEVLEPGLLKLGRSIRERGVLTSWSMVALQDYTTAVAVGLEALQGAFFRPNILFLPLPQDLDRRNAKKRVIERALAIRVGVVIFASHPSAALGRQKDIHLWIRPPFGRWDANDAFEMANLNLILLAGFRFWRLWRGRLTLLTVVDNPEEKEQAAAFLDELCDLARLPLRRVSRQVLEGSFDTAIDAVPAPDLSIFGLSKDTPDLEWADQMVHRVRSSCLFVLDSGRASARA